jgi:hypothetical protein
MDHFKSLLSPKRAQFYIDKATESGKQPFEVYQSNINLSENFYASLHYFEIILRNKIAKHISKKWKNWFELGSDFVKHTLDLGQKNQLEVVQYRLSALQKDISEDAVISELSLGFWTSLMDKKYAQTIWGQNKAKFIFPNLKKIDPGQISTDLDRVRRFRNRIFHYEQILTYDHEKMRDILYNYLEFMINKKCEFKNQISKKAPDRDKPLRGSFS